MRRLKVNLGERSYNILIKRGLIEHCSKYIKKVFNGKKIVIISDENVYLNYGSRVEESLKSGGYQTSKIILRPGESNKLIANLPDLYKRLIDFNLTRSDLIISLGGGVIGDLTGFVASTYLRGLPYIQIPTSLLAQVDSSVGGKVAVDLPEGKNLVGSFYQPELVLIDPDVLNTLSAYFYRDGMAEVIKYSCIYNSELYELLTSLTDRRQLMKHIEDIIYNCCDYKRTIVEQDERDRGTRMKLNFGHTLGHSLEAYTNYSKYSHGQAVAIGMATVTKISEEKGLTRQGTTGKITSLLRQYGLPTDAEADIKKLLPYIINDKKHLEGNLNLVLLNEIGESYIYNTTAEFFNLIH